MGSRRRKTLLGIGVVLLVAGAAGLPVVLSQLGKGAGHLVAAPGAIDYGRVPHGDVVTKSVTMRNEGPREVTIRSASVNCSCFEIDMGFTRYLHPGEATDIRIAFKSGMPPAGPLRGKKLSVASDDQSHGLIEVPLAGDIIEVLKVNPEQVEFGREPIDPASRAAKAKSAKVRPGPEYRMNVVRWDVTPQGTWDVTATETEGGIDFLVKVRPDAPTKGLLQGTITMQLELTGADGKVRKVTHALPLKGEWQP